MFLRFKHLHFSNLTPWAEFLNSHCRDTNCRLGCFLSCSRPLQSTLTVLKQLRMSYFLSGQSRNAKRGCRTLICSASCQRPTCCQTPSPTNLFVPADSEGAHMASTLRRRVYLQGDVKNVPINSDGLFCLLAVSPSPLLPCPRLPRPPLTGNRRARQGVRLCAANLNIRRQHSACTSSGPKAA